MYQPLIDNYSDLTDEQKHARREKNLALAELLGLDPSSVKADSFEVMSIGLGTEESPSEVRVRWTGLGRVPRDEFLALFPDAKIV
jgi:hypothetical protein